MFVTSFVETSNEVLVKSVKPYEAVQQVFKPSV